MGDTDPDLTAFLADFVTEHKRALFERVLDERTAHVRVVFEDVYQQHNASACLRSCDGFGVQHVHAIEATNRFDPDGEIALGASQWLTVHRHPDVETCLRELRDDGFRIVATSPHATAVSLYELDVVQPLALVFGSEMPGISADVSEAADVCVRIPMYGFTESFNVSVSAALCLQHVVQRVRTSDVDWRLSPDERAAVRAQFIRAAIGHRLPQYVRRYEQERAGPPLES